MIFVAKNIIFTIKEYSNAMIFSSLFYYEIEFSIQITKNEKSKLGVNVAVFKYSNGIIVCAGDESGIF